MISQLPFVARILSDLQGTEGIPGWRSKLMQKGNTQLQPSAEDPNTQLNFRCEVCPYKRIVRFYLSLQTKTIFTIRTN